MTTEMWFVLKSALDKRHQPSFAGLVYHVNAECDSISWAGGRGWKSGSERVEFDSRLAPFLTIERCRRCHHARGEAA
jgi:hypothetical protein